VCKRGDLEFAEEARADAGRTYLRCQACDAGFPVQDGVPVFLPAEILYRSSDRDFSTLNAITRQKVLQREWHDKAHIDDGTAYKQSTYTDQGLFAFLLYYQLREVDGVLAKKKFSRIANICCGHGFELDYLSLLGSKLIVIDISLKSLQKAIAKAKSLGIEVEALCCDAENLPLRNDSCDLVLTHHSLHHLADPIAGVEEMLRIGSSQIVLCEPAKGVMRSLVRAFGIKPEVEESGNAVYEFSRREIRDVCRKTDARLRYFQKSLVTGPTSEPAVFKKLDKNGVSSVLSSSLSLANRLLGPVIGTKCSVVIDKHAKREAAS
jgi:SAM-dependent methyltransferase/uncharacterized protein YbaR (Trm112 family)